MRFVHFLCRKRVVLAFLTRQSVGLVVVERDLAVLVYLKKVDNTLDCKCLVAHLLK